MAVTADPKDPHPHFDFKREASRRKCFCTIVVDGKDVTDRLDPHLLTVTVIDKIGADAGVDEASIELDDRGGLLAIPPDNANIEVWLGWHTEAQYRVFTGVVREVESGFGRKQGGRRLWITATGFDTAGYGKSPVLKSWGEGAPPGKLEGNPVSFGDVMKQLGGINGLTMNITDKIAGLTRDYYAMTTESFHHFAMRMGKEVGAQMKIQGKTFNNTPTIYSVGPDGRITEDVAKGQMVIAQWGVNLIGWRIKPFVGRPQMSEATSSFYNMQKAAYESINSSMGGPAPFGNAVKAIMQLPAPAPNRSVGQQNMYSQQSDARNKRGQGWVMINGEPQAMASGRIIIVGARGGVDGVYQIEEATHRYSRQGYTTRCEVKQPSFTPTSKGAFPGDTPLPPSEGGATP